MKHLSKYQKIKIAEIANASFFLFLLIREAFSDLDSAISMSIAFFCIELLFTAITPLIIFLAEFFNNKKRAEDYAQIFICIFGGAALSITIFSFIPYIDLDLILIMFIMTSITKRIYFAFRDYDKFKILTQKNLVSFLISITLSTAISGYFFADLIEIDYLPLFLSINMLELAALLATISHLFITGYIFPLIYLHKK